MGEAAMSTGAMNATLVFEEGEQVYPCRCGEIHRGSYAAEDWAHHNCLHDCRLIFVQYEPGEFAEGDVICPQCGNTWDVRNT